jgi:23S rRNA pseudouridine1911/1915/1917 synthase
MSQSRKISFVCKEKGRLDKSLQRSVNESPASNAALRRAVFAGRITINGVVCRRPDFTVRPGDRIEGMIEERIAPAIPSKPVIVYRDEFIIAVDKPPGLPTHKTSDPSRANLYDLLCSLLAEEMQMKERPSPLPELPPEKRPGLLHRLDAETSGLLLFTLRREMNASLAKQFEGHSIEKRYLALVSCSFKLPATWTCSDPILRAERKRNRYRTARPDEEGMSAVTHFRTVWQKNKVALIEARPVTGRPHQIRVHLSAGGTPIIGDTFYGKEQNSRRDDIGRKEREEKAGRLMLHAYELVFEHPATGKRMTLRTKEPDFAEAKNHRR